MDIETANTIADEHGKMDMSNVLMYDCGWQVMDTRGNIYEKRSYVNYDIFGYQKELMKSAYYANKIPQYEADIRQGLRQVKNTYEIRENMLWDINLYGIKEVAAFNARFDVNGLNMTRRYVTSSQYRYWFPRDIIIWDIMKMAGDTICKRKSYRDFCFKHDILTKTIRPKKTVQAIWCYLTQNPEFQEAHTGLEDVEIEGKIMIHCMRQHKKMRKELYKEQFTYEEPTELQKTIWKNLREPVNGFKITAERE